MGAPYTPDLRERVVATFRSGLSRAETAALFRVSESSVQRWSRLERTRGSVAAQPMGGQRPFALAGERAGILERIAQQPDLPLRALLAELHDRGIKGTRSGTSSTVPVSATRRRACTPANRIVRRSPGGVCNGNSGRTRSTPGGLFSLTKPGPRRT